MVKINIPKELIEQIDDKNVVPFVGAGFSYLFGYPTWNELLSKIMEKLRIDVKLEDLKGKSTLQTAEALFEFFKDENYEVTFEELKEKYFKDAILNQSMITYLNEKAQQELELNFNKLVCECLSKQDRSTTEEEFKHIKLLNKFDFKHIVTTNYDTVLESEIIDKPCVMYPGRGKELNNLEEKNNSILYKIHGDMKDPVSIVLTNSQYYRFMYNEGYYKSKLYTFFASNTIMMIGYSFNDINIHDIYFEFRKDYGKLLNTYNENNTKVYLVIRKEEKERQNGYYLLYEKYLNSCGIKIIDDFESIPEFLMNLYEQLRYYRENKDLEKLIHVPNLEYMKSVLVDMMKGIETALDRSYIEDILKSVIHIFKYPSILSKAPFNIDLSKLEEGERIPETTGLNLLNSVYKLGETDETILELQYYHNIIVQALEFAEDARHRLGGFYYYPDRFKVFFKLAIKAKSIRLDNQNKKHFSEMFGQALRYSGYEFGSCYGSAKVINSEICKLPEDLINIYIEDIESKLEEFNEHSDEIFGIIGNKEVEWLKQFIDKRCWSKEMIDRISTLISKIEQSRAMYFGG